MKYVYLLESVDYPEETYVGLTDNVGSRLAAHNAGRLRRYGWQATAAQPRRLPVVARRAKTG
jgi:predicted GIY-YIG superfamily endonuclease